jgi:hypothetical protein
MGFRSPRALLLETAGVILALCARLATGAPANPQGTTVFVPFTGCASSGQIEALAAPAGASRSAPISPKDAQKLAYYKSADGIGLLAPRGWYCEGASGSSGYVLFLSPKPIGWRLPGFKGLEGPAIELYHITYDSSGRYEIAEIMARVFPEYRALASRIWEGIASPFPSGPFPNDTLTYQGKTVVEYSTPAQTEGLGTRSSWLGKNDSPVVGTAILIGDPPDLLLLSMRLPPELARLTPVIVREVERDAVDSSRK